MFNLALRQEEIILFEMSNKIIYSSLYVRGGGNKHELFLYVE